MRKFLRVPRRCVLERTYCQPLKNLMTSCFSCIPSVLWKILNMFHFLCSETCLKNFICNVQKISAKIWDWKKEFRHHGEWFQLNHNPLMRFGHICEPAENTSKTEIINLFGKNAEVLHPFIFLQQCNISTILLSTWAYSLIEVCDCF